jgi:hypothetical protein
MKYQISTIVFIVIALVVAILSLLSNQNAQMYAAYATHFFVSIIPVLGTAALVKYIMPFCDKKQACCNGKYNCGDASCCSKESCN